MHQHGCFSQSDEGAARKTPVMLALGPMFPESNHLAFNAARYILIHDSIF